MPQDAHFIATKTVGSEVFVFDWRKFPSEPTNSVCTPTLRLTGHSKEGFGLAWNPNKQGQLLSASDDHLVCMWNIEAARESSLDANTVFHGHSDVVEEVDWHKHHECLFGSVGDDRKVEEEKTEHFFSPLPPPPLIFSLSL